MKRRAACVIASCSDNHFNSMPHTKKQVPTLSSVSNWQGSTWSRGVFNQGTVSLLPPSVPYSWNIRPARSNLMFSWASWSIILLESCFEYRFERTALRFHMNIFQFNVANVCWRSIVSKERYYGKQRCKRTSCHRKENSPQHNAWHRVSIQCRIVIFYMLVGRLWYKAECSKC